MKNSLLSPEEIEAFFAHLREERPHPTTELEYTNPYTLLVAVALSAQATDVSVNKATRGLFSTVDTPEKMVALGEDGLKNYIKTIGLFNTKAKNILVMAQQLLERHNGEIPRDRAALESLAGVGRKTANVVLNTAFGEPTLAVDTHVFRVANRTGLACGRTPLEVETILLRVIPETYIKDAHHWLILLGRYTCTARKPNCLRCPVQEFCRFGDKTI